VGRLFTVTLCVVWFSGVLSLCWFEPSIIPNQETLSSMYINKAPIYIHILALTYTSALHLRFLTLTSVCIANGFTAAVYAFQHIFGHKGLSQLFYRDAVSLNNFYPQYSENGALANAIVALL